MSYQVTLHSRNVLVPLALEDRNAIRMTSPLANLDTATAMMIQVSSSGEFNQEFFPLRIRQDLNQAYAGREWELWSQKSGAGLYTYYLGIPNSFFTESNDGKSVRSLSVQVVGTSPLTGREEFSGGVDVTLHAQVKQPLIPGFLNLSERFFPTLLPHNFIEKSSLDTFSFQDKTQLVLMTALQMDATDRIPVSLGKHWDPVSWIQGMVENISPQANFMIQGGCFFARNHKVTHWFGGSIGLEEKSFRKAATEKILSMGSPKNGAWVFWLEPISEASVDLDQIVNTFSPDAKISIRHPMLHRFLTHHGHKMALSIERPAAIAELEPAQAVAALGEVAQVLTKHQNHLHDAQVEPDHATWSKLSNPSKSAIQAFVSPVASTLSEFSDSHLSVLHADIESLYQGYGETLRVLESLFDETYGYSPWDAVGNPFRETVTGFLADKVFS